jgi:hypothetical protein
LITYLFEEQPHLLSGVLLQWMEASSRFTAFVEAYRDKIRKKIPVVGGRERTLDLRSEVELAFCLLNDRRVPSDDRQAPLVTVAERRGVLSCHVPLYALFHVPAPLYRYGRYTWQGHAVLSEIGQISYLEQPASGYRCGRKSSSNFSGGLACSFRRIEP